MYLDLLATRSKGHRLSPALVQDLEVSPVAGPLGVEVRL